MKKGNLFLSFQSRAAIAFVLLTLGLSVTAHAKDPVTDTYKGVFKDEEKVGEIASINLGTDFLTINTTTIQNISTEGGGKLKSMFVVLGTWDYVYQKEASGKNTKIGLVFRLKAGTYNKAMIGIGKKFAEKLYMDHKEDFKFDGKFDLGDIPGNFEWSFYGTNR